MGDRKLGRSSPLRGLMWTRQDRLQFREDSPVRGAGLVGVAQSPQRLGSVTLRSKHYLPLSFAIQIFPALSSRLKMSRSGVTEISRNWIPAFMRDVRAPWE